ncbi:MAG: 16S rRNA (cytidine(1402)-2'-O)-methyltransferase [Pseudomonadota bacterium]
MRPRRASKGSSQVNESSGAAERRKPDPGLYVVSTPLGNLGDITARAIAVLSGVDLVACEDTRVTRKLLAALGIPSPRLVRYDDRAGAEAVFIQAIQNGKTVALVADAGTPLIADPGYRLVRAAHAAGVKVSAVPGPSAAMAAAAVAGLPCERLLVCGFLPTKAGGRARALAELKTVPATLVFFEAPHRLPASLAAMAAVLGQREAAVVRELTKLFEEIRRASLPELAAHYAGRAPKGEIVVVVAPPASAEREVDSADLAARLEDALATMSLKDAAAAVAAATGLSRRLVYARALELGRRTRP